MTQNNHQVPPTHELLMQLRKLAPKRTLSYAEAKTVAKLQALRMRSLLSLTSPRADLDWMWKLTNVTVKGLPMHEMREITGRDASGFTKRLGNGDYLIAVNRNMSYTHRRFTVAHEFKHLIDYPYRSTFYSRLGFGNKELHDRQIERLCDHFAAHFLVPDNLLKRAWTTGFQELSALAGMFAVSEEAMHIRLQTEGFIATDDGDGTLFRQVGQLRERAQPCGNAA